MPEQDAFDHCAALVRATDKDRFLATLFAPADRRGGLFALYAFNIEISRVRDLARKPMPGEIRLQWWRDALVADSGDVQANPVAVALNDTVTRYQLPRATIIGMIDARTFDLYDDPMGSLAELEAYAARSSSALIALAATVLGEGDRPALAALADHAGIAYAIAGLLSGFGHHAARHQLYVPLDLLQRHGVQTEDIFAGKLTRELVAALTELRLQARSHLKSAKALLASISDRVTPALLPAALAPAMLARMERRGYDPFKIDELPQWRRQWALWRAARRPERMFD